MSHSRAHWRLCFFYSWLSHVVWSLMHVSGTRAGAKEYGDQNAQRKKRARERPVVPALAYRASADPLTSQSPLWDNNAPPSNPRLDLPLAMNETLTPSSGHLVRVMFWECAHRN